VEKIEIKRTGYF